MNTDEKTPTKVLDFEFLKNAVSGSAAAFRCRAKLQPAGGEGDKVFPPTYAGAIYAKEERRVPRGDGNFETIPCVLLDSVQSQANRQEEALQRALDTNRISEAGCTLPVIEVDFSGEALLDQVGRISSLEAPHRAADAILRDSIIDEKGEEKGKAFQVRRGCFAKIRDRFATAPQVNRAVEIRIQRAGNLTLKGVAVRASMSSKPRYDKAFILL